ncbi:hypothetical protein B296_00046913 [Ensete ventricosum]|uniref:Uncharacterized protein n=1 Tax=Ensete ventricosum TaxID=4639 RepID=A0A426Z1X1_ENSVE|nr:hypothetical protein B296_00046913 [Ensete ventricosum]
MKINYVHEFPRRNSPFPGSSETGDPVAVAGDADNEPTLITSRTVTPSSVVYFFLRQSLTISPLSAIGRFSISQHRSSTSMATKDSAAPLPPALCSATVNTEEFVASFPAPLPLALYPAIVNTEKDRKAPPPSVKPPPASPVSKQPSPNPVTEASIDPAAPTRCLSGVVFFLLLLSSSSRVHRQRHQDRRYQAPATVSLPSLTDAATHQQCSCSKGSDSPSHYKQCCLELFGSVTVFTSKCWQSTTITEAKKCAILNTLPRTILPATFSRDRLPLPRSIFPSVGSHLRQRRGKSTSAPLSGQIIPLRYLGSCSRISLPSISSMFSSSTSTSPTLLPLENTSASSYKRTLSLSMLFPSFPSNYPKTSTMYLGVYSFLTSYLAIYYQVMLMVLSVAHQQ